jgi:hypothetical protein
MKNHIVATPNIVKVDKLVPQTIIILMYREFPVIHFIYCGYHNVSNNSSSSQFHNIYQMDKKNAHKISSNGLQNRFNENLTTDNLDKHLLL